MQVNSPSDGRKRILPETTAKFPLLKADKKEGATKQRRYSFP